jgi:hypothetical protein
LYYSSKNSIEFTTLELGCLACSGQLPLGVLLWSHAKQALNPFVIYLIRTTLWHICRPREAGARWTYPSQPRRPPRRAGVDASPKRPGPMDRAEMLCSVWLVIINPYHLVNVFALSYEWYASSKRIILRVVKYGWDRTFLSLSLMINTTH